MAHAAGRAVLHVRISTDGGEVTSRQPSRFPTLDSLKLNLRCLLAGRAAEQVVLGQASAGAGGSHASDLAQATMLATKIEVGFGLGQTGLLWSDVSDDPTPRFLVDPELKQRVTAHLDQALLDAECELRGQQKLLIKVAKALVDRRELDAGAFDKLVDASDGSTPAQSSPVKTADVKQPRASGVPVR